jgi:hypothetical protein
MTVDYLGPASDALEKLIELLANVDYFMAFVGAADAAAAKLRIHEAEYEEEETDTKADRRPCAFVAIEMGAEVGGSGVFSGVAIIRFEKTKSVDHTTAEGFRDFANHVGLIVQELLADAKADTGGTKLNTVKQEEGWRGPYIKKLPKDRWNDAYIFSATGNQYEIRSNAGGSEKGPLSSNDL